MFGTMDRCWRPWEEHDRKLNEDMLNYWTHFMRTGKPTDGDDWKPCTKEEPFVKVFE